MKKKQKKVYEVGRVLWRDWKVGGVFCESFLGFRLLQLMMSGWSCGWGWGRSEPVIDDVYFEHEHEREREHEREHEHQDPSAEVWKGNVKRVKQKASGMKKKRMGTAMLVGLQVIWIVIGMSMVLDLESRLDQETCIEDIVLNPLRVNTWFSFVCSESTPWGPS